MKPSMSFHMVIFSTSVVLMFLTLVFQPCFSNVINEDRLIPPFSASPMSWVDDNGLFLQSLNKLFKLGFVNPSGDGINYYLCIVHGSKPDVVWTANRGTPITNAESMVFQEDGNVVLKKGGSIVWTTNTTGHALQLQDSGNLVVLDKYNQTLWQSFDHPVDTLLPGQKFSSGMSLVSKVSTSDYSEGMFSLKISNKSLMLFANVGELQPYWSFISDSRATPTKFGNVSYAIVQNNSLNLCASDSSLLSQMLFDASATDRILVLEATGKFSSKVFYSGISTDDFNAPFKTSCLPLTCGTYGVCNEGQCSCPSSLSARNSSDMADGCNPPFPACNLASEIRKLDTNIGYFSNAYTTPLQVKDISECHAKCQKNCSCKGGFYSDAGCYLYTYFGTFQVMSSNTNAFLKVQKGKATSYIPYIIAGCALLFILVCVSAFLYWYRKHKLALNEREEEEDKFLGSIPGLPTRFTFKQLQVATNNFSKKLGSGGFGSVFEGTLPDKTKIAVKKLESIAQGKKEFRTEVATIGSIHHVHLVQLRGFCSEGFHRLLVYEYMARGSLEKSLFKKEGTGLTWDIRYAIALGTAKGLAYLHEDCRERIIHCDIKPENILLDENYVAKVSDFGLAKLMNREQSHVFTTMRGTRGYLAPEWLYKLAISEKSDVYSFGMVLLELISGRKNFQPSEASEKLYFPAYAFHQAEEGKLKDIAEIKYKDEAEQLQVTSALKVALWCIQEEVHSRPAMSRVVNMLEGNVEVPNPPLSSHFAMRLHARMVAAVSEKDRSSSSDFNSQDLVSANRLSGPRKRIAVQLSKLANVCGKLKVQSESSVLFV